MRLREYSGSDAVICRRLKGSVADPKDALVGEEEPAGELVPLFTSVELKLYPAPNSGTGLTSNLSS